jgi:hypothetical protein
MVEVGVARQRNSNVINPIHPEPNAPRKDEVGFFAILRVGGQLPPAEAGGLQLGSSDAAIDSA